MTTYACTWPSRQRKQFRNSNRRFLSIHFIIMILYPPQELANVSTIRRLKSWNLSGQVAEIQDRKCALYKKVCCFKKSCTECWKQRQMELNLTVQKEKKNATIQEVSILFWQRNERKVVLNDRPTSRDILRFQKTLNSLNRERSRPRETKRISIQIARSPGTSDAGKM